MNSANGKEPVRLLALSDGLFATVLTLLVLDLAVPEALNAGGESTTAFVRWVGPHLFSYVLTFLVAGTYWLAHRRNFDRYVAPAKPPAPVGRARWTELLWRSGMVLPWLLMIGLAVWAMNF